MVKHSRLRAQVAPYIEAIKKERKEGGTWGDIGEVLGMTAKQVRLAVKHCRYQVEQIPLPEPEPEPTPARPAAAMAARPAGQQQTAAANKKLFDSLPSIGGRK